ncbi:MAG: hypothetical protein E7633_00155 [Ruminococcaceae bacterium]|nr:hypothetical protein [Oscillospiraceae bacterium]
MNSENTENTEPITPDTAESPEASIDAPKEPNLSNSNEKEAKAPANRSKKNAIIFASVILSLLVVLPILTFVDWNALFNIGSQDEDKDSWIHFYGDQYFRTPDYDEDIEKDKDYMDLDRLMYYTNGNETFQVIDNPEDFGKCCVLFYNYFENLKRGDYKRYYALFTDEYEEEYGNTNPFTKRELKYTPQKIYNIRVTLIQSTFLENGDADGNYVGSTVHYFNVEYAIKDNNGTYRRDILSDQSRSIVFEILETNGKVLINDISFYRSAGSTNKD